MLSLRVLGTGPGCQPAPLPSVSLLQDEDADEKAKARRASKPAEWRALFSGNVDDHFRLGIKLTRGAIKYGHALCT